MSQAFVKVRLKFNGNGEAPKETAVVNMQSIPRVGEYLVSGNAGMCQVLRVVHTPETPTQDVVLVLGPPPPDFVFNTNGVRVGVKDACEVGAGTANERLFSEKH